VPALLSRDGVESIVVAPLGADFYNPGHRSRRVAAVELAADVDPRSAEARAWTGRWVFASRALVDEAAAASVDQRAPELEAVSATAPAERLAYVRGELAAVRAPVTRRMLVDAVWRFSWPHDRLVVAASRLVREADAAVAGKRIPVYSNRGLAGIDGTIATAIGVALARSDGDPRGITRVLIGDLALLHDVGSLLLAPTEERPRVQVIVGNDGGGTIFDSLEVAGSAPADAMDRVLLTPQEVDLASLARAYGWEHSRATNRGELDQALSAPPDSPSILEVPLGRRAP
jgi:2-succinyl-5-enolpyruvyl-6-hydroxy-3-cyclohexene-1-carboxylate synthase